MHPLKENIPPSRRNFAVQYKFCRTHHPLNLLIYTNQHLRGPRVILIFSLPLPSLSILSPLTPDASSPTGDSCSPAPPLPHRRWAAEPARAESRASASPPRRPPCPLLPPHTRRGAPAISTTRSSSSLQSPSSDPCPDRPGGRAVRHISTPPRGAPHPSHRPAAARARRRGRNPAGGLVLRCPPAPLCLSALQRCRRSS
jgi:hypothetical protein